MIVSHVVDDESERQVIVSSDRGGPYVQWFIEDDDGTRVSFWYAETTAECVERAKGPWPHAATFMPIDDNGCPPFDAATATGMYDRE